MCTSLTVERASLMRHVAMSASYLGAKTDAYATMAPTEADNEPLEAALREAQAEVEYALAAAIASVDDTPEAYELRLRCRYPAHVAAAMEQMLFTTLSAYVTAKWLAQIGQAEAGAEWQSRAADQESMLRRLAMPAPTRRPFM